MWDGMVDECVVCVCLCLCFIWHDCTYRLNFKWIREYLYIFNRIYFAWGEIVLNSVNTLKFNTCCGLFHSLLCPVLFFMPVGKVFVIVFVPFCIAFIRIDSYSFYFTFYSYFHFKLSILFIILDSYILRYLFLLLWESPFGQGEAAEWDIGDIFSMR